MIQDAEDKGLIAPGKVSKLYPELAFFPIQIFQDLVDDNMHFLAKFQVFCLECLNFELTCFLGSNHAGITTGFKECPC